MEFWLFWIFISIGCAIGLIVLGLLWWYFAGGKESEQRYQEQKERKRLIMTKVSRIADYEYEIEVNGARFKVDLDKLLVILSTPEE